MPILHLTAAELRAAATGDVGHDVPWTVTDPRTVLVVDLDDSDAPPVLGSETASVVVGTTAEDVKAVLTSDVANGCDVVLSRDDERIDDIAAAVDANPLAATSLALLLRGSEERTVDDGLHAESAVYSFLQAAPEFAAWRASRPVRGREPEPPEVVRVERDEQELTLTLCRPHVHNALNSAMRDQLLSGLALVDVEPAITTIHLRGDGPTFCSGGDLDEFGSSSDPARAHFVRLTASVGRAIHRHRWQVVAHVHGACAGSGVELPSFAGHVIADPAATFALPEVQLGLVPGAGGTVSLPRRIGRHRTAELALTGRPVDATTALAWGLVDAVAPA